MIKAIIFDCFGVIYPDTLALVERKFLDPSDMTKKEQISNLRRESDRGSISRDQFWLGASKILNISPKELDNELNKVRGADWGLLEYIKTLKQKYKTAVLSNVGRGFLERIFDKSRRAEDYFDAIVASADIGFMKPQPEAYLAVSKQLNTNPKNCVFIDDREGHCEGAKKVGMNVVLYENFEQMKRQLEHLLIDKS